MQDTQEKQKQILLALGKIIKKHRLSAKKSISKLSDEIEMAKSTWSDLEAGKYNDILFTNLWKISEGLDVPLETIIIELKQELGPDFSLCDL